MPSRSCLKMLARPTVSWAGAPTCTRLFSSVLTSGLVTGIRMRLARTLRLYAFSSFVLSSISAWCSLPEAITALFEYLFVMVLLVGPCEVDLSEAGTDSRQLTSWGRSLAVEWGTSWYLYGHAQCWSMKPAAENLSRNVSELVATQCNSAIMEWECHEAERFDKPHRLSLCGAQ